MDALNPSPMAGQRAPPPAVKIGEVLIRSFSARAVGRFLFCREFSQPCANSSRPRPHAHLLLEDLGIPHGHRASLPIGLGRAKAKGLGGLGFVKTFPCSHVRQSLCFAKVPGSFVFGNSRPVPLSCPSGFSWVLLAESRRAPEGGLPVVAGTRLKLLVTAHSSTHASRLELLRAPEGGLPVVAGTRLKPSTHAARRSGTIR